MAYARHYTLKKIAKDVGWGWVDTNRYNRTGKSHLLQMRKENLVQYVYGDSSRIYFGIGRRPYGSERITNWYTITFVGLQKLLGLWPDDENIREMAHFIFKKMFGSDSHWKDEIHYRSPKTT